MRQAGTLSNRDHAQRLADYLLTQGIEAKVDADGDGWALWIRDEDHLPQAIELLQEFQADPLAAKYRQAGQTAQSLRKQQAREDAQRRKNFVELRGRWDRRHAGPRPLTMVLIAICIFVSLATQFGQQNNRLLQALMFQSIPDNALADPSWSVTRDIDQGQWWRLVTPIFVHFTVLHLLFNLFWLYDLGSLIETRRGTLRFAALVLVVAATSNYGQYFFPFELGWDFGPPSIKFGGMSGVVFGMFGYVWMKSRFQPQAGLFLGSNTVFIILAVFALCWTGVLGPIANWAHTVGLVVGMAIGYAPTAWRNLGRR